jgi:hypothetical protein
MLSVVVPLFNEQDNILALQREIAAALDGNEYELILVDDCSSDGTLQRIQRGPGVRVIEFTAKTPVQVPRCTPESWPPAAKSSLYWMGTFRMIPPTFARCSPRLSIGADLVCG